MADGPPILAVCDAVFGGKSAILAYRLKPSQLCLRNLTVDLEYPPPSGRRKSILAGTYI